jgi:hypothetical protein
MKIAKKEGKMPLLLLVLLAIIVNMMVFLCRFGDGGGFSLEGFTDYCGRTQPNRHASYGSSLWASRSQ